MLGAAGAARRIGQPARDRARGGHRPPGRHAADGQGRAPDRRLDLDVADPRRRGPDRRRGRLHARHQHAHRGRGARCAAARRSSPTRSSSRRSGAGSGTSSSNEVSWSPELYRILGYDPDRFAASYEAYFEAIHPADRARAQAAGEDTIAGGPPVDLECRVAAARRRRAGHPRPRDGRSRTTPGRSSGWSGPSRTSPGSRRPGSGSSRPTARTRRC